MAQKSTKISQAVEMVELEEKPNLLLTLPSARLVCFRLCSFLVRIVCRLLLRDIPVKCVHVRCFRVSVWWENLLSFLQAF